MFQTCCYSIYQVRRVSTRHYNPNSVNTDGINPNISHQRLLVGKVGLLEAQLGTFRRTIVAILRARTMWIQPLG